MRTWSPCSQAVVLMVLISWCVASGAGRVAELERYWADGSFMLLDETHVRVGSGLISIGPSLRRVGGLRRLISPPWSGSDFKLDLLFNGHPVVPDTYIWYPDEIQQWGKLGPLSIQTTTIPLRSTRGVVMVIEVANKGLRPEPVEMEMKANLTLDRPAGKAWDYTAPESLTPTQAEAHHGACPRKDDYFDAGTRFTNSHGTLIVNLISPHPLPVERGAVEGLTIAPGTSQRLYVLAVLGGDADYARVRLDLDATLAANDKAWAELATQLHARVPRLRASDSALVRFYDRSLVTALTSRWHVPEFVTLPHYAEGGIDGRGMCIYLWGVGYVSEMLAITDPSAMRAMLERFLQNDLMKSYAYAPLTGEAVGRWYAYNNYSLVRAVYDYVMITGDQAFLLRSVKGKTVLQWVNWHALWPKPEQGPALVDYGVNKNLLELERTDAYSHFVPSPNGERYASLQMAAALQRLSGQPSGAFESKAHEVRQLVVKELWDPQQRWMESRGQQQDRQVAFSIQVFDLLRDHMLPRSVQDSLLTHLNEREFLSAYGVHSLAKTDPGYDYRDVDWGGPGVYAGDAPELVEDLAKAGYPARAENLLRRILWWGTRFPYIPQAVRADVMDYRHDGLANSISGLGGAQSIIFGIFGVKFLPHQQLRIQPQALSGLKQQSLEGLLFASKRISIEVHRKTFTVTVNGNRVTRKLGASLVLDHEGNVAEVTP